MAEPTPWQLASAGQKVYTKPQIVTVYSHGTVNWPYQPQKIVVGSTGSNTAGVYGVNTHQSSSSDGSGGSSSGGTGPGSGSGGSGGNGGGSTPPGGGSCGVAEGGGCSGW